MDNNGDEVTGGGVYVGEGRSGDGVKGEMESREGFILGLS